MSESRKARAAKRAKALTPRRGRKAGVKLVRRPLRVDHVRRIFGLVHEVRKHNSRARARWTDRVRGQELWPAGECDRVLEPAEISRKDGHIA